MDISEYYKQLEAHDWYYSFSDDSRAYNAGHDNEKRLYALRGESEKHAALYDAFLAHKSSGKPWGTQEQPKPNLSDFLN